MEVNCEKCEYKKFYEMVKKWVKYDYCVPGLKAEVTIDMLISEFIGEIVSFYLKGHTLDLEKGHTLKLIAKEFPIKAKNAKRKELRNAKIDYLLFDDAGDGELVFVELKTSDDSISSHQLDNYQKRLSKGKIIKFFDDIIASNKVMKKHDSDKICAPKDINQTQKYITTVNTMLEVTDSKSWKECIEKLEKCEKRHVMLFYLTLTKKQIENIDIKASKSDVNIDIKADALESIIRPENKECSEFKNRLDDKKKITWDKTREILETLFEESKMSEIEKLKNKES